MVFQLVKPVQYEFGVHLVLQQASKLLIVQRNHDSRKQLQVTPYIRRQQEEQYADALPVDCVEIYRFFQVCEQHNRFINVHNKWVSRMRNRYAFTNSSGCERFTSQEKLKQKGAVERVRYALEFGYGPQHVVALSTGYLQVDASPCEGFRQTG